MSSLPRNPRYFPKMKVRGARRRQLAPFQRVTGQFYRLVISSAEADEAVQRLTKVLTP